MSSKHLTHSLLKTEKADFLLISAEIYFGVWSSFLPSCRSSFGTKAFPFIFVAFPLKSENKINSIYIAKIKQSEWQLALLFQKGTLEHRESWLVSYFPGHILRELVLLPFLRRSFATKAFPFVFVAYPVLKQPKWKCNQVKSPRQVDFIAKVSIHLIPIIIKATYNYHFTSMHVDCSFFCCAFHAPFPCFSFHIINVVEIK